MSFSFGAFGHSYYMIQIVVDISMLYKFVLKVAVLIVIAGYNAHATSLLFAANLSHVTIFIAVEVLCDFALFIE